MFRRKSRAIVTTPSGERISVLPPSISSGPSVASDAAIQSSLTINQPNNIQLASVTGFINGVNGNITKCVLNNTTPYGVYPMEGSGNLAYMMINMYNIAITMDAYNKQLKPNYDLNKIKTLRTNDGSRDINFTNQMTNKIDISITSLNPDNTTSSTTGSISLDTLTSIEVNLYNTSDFSYNSNTLPDSLPLTKLMMSSIIPLSIINGICIVIDTHVRDGLLLGPLVRGDDDTTLAVIFYTTQKLLNGINNVCTNIPQSNPQLSSTVVAAAANNTTTLQAQISTLTQEQTQLTQQLQASQSSYNEISDNYNNVSSQLNQVHNQLSQTQSNDTSTINNLNSQAQTLQDQLSKLSVSMESETNLYNTTKSDLDTAKSQISSLQSQLKDEAKLLDTVNSKLASGAKYIKELYILILVLVFIIVYILMRNKKYSISPVNISGGIGSLYSSYY